MNFFCVTLFVLTIITSLCDAQTVECFFCEAAAEFFLLDPSGVDDIGELLDKFCSILPNATEAQCIAGVKSLEVFIDQLPLFLKRKEQFTSYALCTMVNICSIDCCVSDAPEQVHVSFLDDPHTSVGITWVTRQQYLSIVQYGTTPTELTQSVTGSTKTYTPGYWKGWIHNVPLTHLQPGTRYYYRAGSTEGGWSKVFRFTTEDTNSNKQVVRFANIGDMGLQNSENNIIALKQLVADDQVNFIIHNGDISYADGFQQRWDMFFREVEDAVANTAYMVNLGNHEIGVIAALNLTVGYVHRFMLPGPFSLSLDYENLFYSWNYGSIHFVAIDTESILDIALLTTKQIDWITNDLQSVDRTRYPWVIVYGHRPFYCSDNDVDCSTMAEALRDGLEEIFYKYRVNLVIQAHKHNYERMWPTYRGIPTKSYDKPQVPVYILNGAGGNREGVEQNATPPYQPYSAHFIPAWGRGIVTVYNETVLDYDFYASDNGALVDHVTLIRA